jgi:hypothetical protein
VVLRQINFEVKRRPAAHLPVGGGEQNSEKNSASAAKTQLGLPQLVLPLLIVLVVTMMLLEETLKFAMIPRGSLHLVMMTMVCSLSLAVANSSTAKVKT